MEWLLAHVDDEIPAVAAVATGPSSTEPAEQTTEKSDESSSASGAEGSTLEAKSIKCEDCGRLFRFVFTLYINIWFVIHSDGSRTNLEVEFHATKSGHANFSESTEEKKPLSEEEKKAQLRLIEEKITQKRAEREEREKQEALEKERLRIKSGKDMTEVRRNLEEEEMKKIVSSVVSYCFF